MGNLVPIGSSQLTPYERDFPLHHVCYNGDTDKVKKLLEKRDLDINQLDNNGCSAVFRAGQMLQIDILELLFQKGAAPTDIHNILGLMIHLSAIQSPNTYLQLGTESYGVRPFETRFLKILDILLKNDADPEGAYSYLEQQKCLPVVFQYLNYIKRRQLVLYRYA
jgi:ankyrin repeat protein